MRVSTARKVGGASERGGSFGTLGSAARRADGDGESKLESTGETPTAVGARN